jgi:hypothetical protein
MAPSIALLGQPLNPLYLLDPLYPLRTPRPPRPLLAAYKVLVIKSDGPKKPGALFRMVKKLAPLFGKRF